MSDRMTDLIEKVAKKIHEKHPFSWCEGIPWDELSGSADSACDQYRAIARTAIETIEAAKNPDGL